MSEYMSERMLEPEYMSERMPSGMSKCMSEIMPDGMSECVSERMLESEYIGQK